MRDLPLSQPAPLILALLHGTRTQARFPVAVPAAPSMDLHPLTSRAKHPRPYLDSYRSGKCTPANPRGMSGVWCWWTRDDRMGASFPVGIAPGDRLWVREDFATTGGGPLRYAATDDIHELRRINPADDMQRWASRLTLHVTDVRVQPLHEITDEDALAEGVDRTNTSIPGYATARFMRAWDQTQRPTWAHNPWVAALTFTVSQQNIDKETPST